MWILKQLPSLCVISLYFDYLRFLIFSLTSKDPIFSEYPIFFKMIRSFQNVRYFTKWSDLFLVTFSKDPIFWNRSFGFQKRSDLLKSIFWFLKKIVCIPDWHTLTGAMTQIWLIRVKPMHPSQKCIMVLGTLMVEKKWQLSIVRSVFKVNLIKATLIIDQLSSHYDNRNNNDHIDDNIDDYYDDNYDHENCQSKNKPGYQHSNSIWSWWCTK